MQGSCCREHSHVQSTLIRDGAVLSIKSGQAGIEVAASADPADPESTVRVRSPRGNSNVRNICVAPVLVFRRSISAPAHVTPLAVAMRSFLLSIRRRGE